jgi:hypothetical protein
MRDLVLNRTFDETISVEQNKFKSIKIFKMDCYFGSNLV